MIKNPEPKKILVVFSLFIAFLSTLNCCSERQKTLNFPFDHGPHFDSRNEWWYFTGEVQTLEGGKLGFEFTIFKRWIHRIKDFVYLGHIAVSNPETSEHLFAEEGALHPVSNIEEGKTAVQFNNFSYSFSEPEGFLIEAKAGSLSINLSLIPTMDVLPHGQDGVIAMGDGLYSYYYSFTNLLTLGTILVDGFEYPVSSGRTWMDHQWGNFTFFGLFWDWFSLRFDDGSALMLFQFRGISDNIVRSNWTFRSSEGVVQYGHECSVQANRIYQDKNGNCSYPIDWEVNVPALDAGFFVSPLFDEQSLYNVKTPYYWEGLCSIGGTMGDTDVTGSAYVELTGYEDSKLNYLPRP